MHMPRGVVKFHKDKQGLPYIDLDRSSEDAAIMLIQLIKGQCTQECKTEERMHGQPVQGNCVY